LPVSDAAFDLRDAEAQTHIRPISGPAQKLAPRRPAFAENLARLFATALPRHESRTRPMEEM